MDPMCAGQKGGSLAHYCTKPPGSAEITAGHGRRPVMFFRWANTSGADEHWDWWAPNYIQSLTSI